MAAIPIACSLSAAQLEGRKEVLAQLKGGVLETQELSDGFSFRFSSGDEWLEAAYTIIKLERQCCPFLHFKLSAEPAQGPLWLEITGPLEAKGLIQELFA